MMLILCFGYLHTEIVDLVDAFPLDSFYCPPVDVIIDELSRTRGHGNIIHHETGFKADLYFVRDDELHLWGLKNVHIAEFEGKTFKVAPVEYVVIRKLEFYKEGGSDKHLNDIVALLRINEELN